MGRPMNKNFQRKLSKAATVHDVLKAGFNLEPLSCLFCKSTEVTFNQGIGDAHCASCGEWQLEKETNLSKPIGALATIQWTDTKETITRYFSFGQWNEDDNEDEFGVPDDAIFFYAFEGVPELERMKSSPEHDFFVISWTLCHDLEMALNYCVNRTPY